MPEAEEPVASGGKDEEGEVKESASKSGPPPGVVPLFFSGPSQQIFGCVVDTDLTAEHPHKLIPKEKILEDFRNRAAVCDFHPVKQKMLVSSSRAKGVAALVPSRPNTVAEILRTQYTYTYSL